MVSDVEFYFNYIFLLYQVISTKGVTI